MVVARRQHQSSGVLQPSVTRKPEVDTVIRLRGAAGLLLITTLMFERLQDWCRSGGQKFFSDATEFRGEFHEAL